jgi:hypothetical protein
MATAVCFIYTAKIGESAMLGKAIFPSPERNSICSYTYMYMYIIIWIVPILIAIIHYYYTKILHKNHKYLCMNWNEWTVVYNNEYRVLYFGIARYVMQLPIPSPTVFSSLLSGDIQRLCSCSQDELRPFLPCLARMVLCSRPTPVPAVVNEVTAPRGRSNWERRRKIVHALIAGMGEVNAISKYLTVDFYVSGCRPHVQT